MLSFKNLVLSHKLTSVVKGRFSHWTPGKISGKVTFWHLYLLHREAFLELSQTTGRKGGPAMFCLSCHRTPCTTIFWFSWCSGKGHETYTDFSWCTNSRQFNGMENSWVINGEFLMGHEDLRVLFWPFHHIFLAHEMYFVPCPLTFSWVKLMAKWYHENGIKTPLKVNHFKNYAYLNLSQCAFYLI